MAGSVLTTFLLHCWDVNYPAIDPLPFEGPIRVTTARPFVFDMPLLLVHRPPFLPSPKFIFSLVTWSVSPPLVSFHYTDSTWRPLPLRKVTGIQSLAVHTFPRLNLIWRKVRNGDKYFTSDTSYVQGEKGWNYRACLNVCVFQCICFYTEKFLTFFNSVSVCFYHLLSIGDTNVTSIFFS